MKPIRRPYIDLLQGLLHRHRRHIPHNISILTTSHLLPIRILPPRPAHPSRRQHAEDQHTNTPIRQKTPRHFMDTRLTRLHPVPQLRCPRTNIPSLHNLLPSTLLQHQQSLQSGRCRIDIVRQANGRYNSTTRLSRIKESECHNPNTTRRTLRRPHNKNLCKIRSRLTHSWWFRRRFHTPNNRRYTPPPTHLFFPSTPHKNPRRDFHQGCRDKRLVPKRNQQLTSIHHAFLNRK